MQFQNSRTRRVDRSCLLGGSLAYARPIRQQISTLPEKTEACPKRERVSADLIGSIDLEPVRGNAAVLPPVAEPISPNLIELLVERPLDSLSAAGPEGGGKLVPVFTRGKKRETTRGLSGVQPPACDHLDEKISSPKRKYVHLKRKADFGGSGVVDTLQGAVAALFMSGNPHLDSTRDLKRLPKRVPRSRAKKR